jgi:diguanylate cyclase (GGDEF)-like protein
MAHKNEILIADDSWFNRQSLIDILKNDYVILEAENGKQAMEILGQRKKTIAAVILDLVMPVMDGFQVLEEIGKNEEYKYIPVIVATANDDDDNEVRSLKLGAWDFMPKTFHEEIIRFRIKNAIEKSKVRELEYDAMTGLYTKQKFFQATRELLDRRKESTFAFIHFDIDRFKMVNSLYGTAEGDRLLNIMANAIEDTLYGMENATYGRIHADIFGICVEQEQPNTVKTVLESIEKKIHEKEFPYLLQTAAGVYIIEYNEMDVTQIFDNAALAAEQCKGQYIVQRSFYTRKMGSRLMQEQKIINEMEKALQEEQFKVYFQPKYDMEDCKPHGAEALVRWQKPDGTMISPGEFIPLFEKNGFIIKLDYYVWEKVCQFIRAELDTGRDISPISVNVSRVNLYNPKFIESLVDLVEKYKIPPRYLYLELTESAFSESMEQIQDAVKKLHKVGFTILMDDFGSGYSSLNVLKDVDLDVLKIDMKFLSKGAEEKGTKILEAVIAMAKSLDMPVIAEGVEEEQQVELLTRLGCRYIQGYYFARPMPTEQYYQLIEEQS